MLNVSTKDNKHLFKERDKAINMSQLALNQVARFEKENEVGIFKDEFFFKSTRITLKEFIF